jgi:glycosyltransferase involved in cell wall biosynthesis
VSRPLGRNSFGEGPRLRPRMPARTVDIVAVGPPPRDPYEPAASAWALAAALADQGNDVHVLHLPGSDAGPLPNRVSHTVVEIPLRRPGGPVEPAEFAAAAGRRLRKTPDLILRDPVGLGSLGFRRSRRSGPFVAAFARGVELESFDGTFPSPAGSGIVNRVDTWLDRRSVRRLERVALEEADRVYYDAPEVARSLTDQYDVPERKLATLPSAVASLPPLPKREASRQDLRIPTDVPVVVAPAAFETLEPAGLDRVLEAFRRVRPFFPGVRLVVAGATAPSDPGVISLPDRRASTLAEALAGADVAIFARRVPGFDPGLALAARAAIPPIALPTARLGPGPADGVRLSVSEDPGDLASVLAEVLADPALQKELGRKAAVYAKAFQPESVARTVTESLARLPA